MESAYIDLAGCKSCKQMHAIIKKELNLPEYYGMNLSALWDCLTGHIDYPISITIVDIDKLGGDLRLEALRMLRVFMRAADQNPEINIMASARSFEDADRLPEWQ